MIRNIQRKYFEIWGNEEAQNAFLKGLLIILSILFLFQSIVLTIVYLRKPVLVAIGNTETKVLTLAPPPEELLKSELTRTVKNYAEAHYNWDSATVEAAHERASKYVSSQFVKAFKNANAEQVKLAQSKKLTQKIYVTDVKVDSKNLTARIFMDRILSIDGLRAATLLTLDVTFEYGPRTDANPQGIYITGEKFISQGG
jgi:hypothetical protein